MEDERRDKELTVEQIVERLRLSSPEIVSDVYAISVRQLDAEDKRETNLNTKATSLLSASGVSVTVGFAFGGVLAQRPELLEMLGPPGSGRRVFFVACYVVAVFAGIVGGFLAVRALRISAYVTVAESDVFGEELATADEARDASRYRRYVTAHLWLIYRRNFRKHESKAKTISLGQRAYRAFLVLLIPPLIAMGIFMTTKTQSENTAQQPVQMSSQPQKPAEPAQAPVTPAAPATAPAQKPPATAVPSSGQLFQSHVKPDELPGNVPVPAKQR